MFGQLILQWLFYNEWTALFRKNALFQYLDFCVFDESKNFKICEIPWNYCSFQLFFNQFSTSIPLLYLWFSDVFRRHRSGTFVKNVLRIQDNIKKNRSDFSVHYAKHYQLIVCSIMTAGKKSNSLLCFW